jgi:hypothetical protein
MKDWRNFELEGIRYRVNLTEAEDGMLVEAYSAEPFRDRKKKCYVRVIVNMDSSAEFHCDERVDFPIQTGDYSSITEAEFKSNPAYIGLRAAFNLGVEEARKRLREGAR